MSDKHRRATKPRAWSGLVRPSTRAFFQAGRRMPDYSLFDWLHGYVYGRWPYLYISIGTGEHPLVRLLGPPARWLLGLLLPREDGRSSDSSEHASFADTYHGKVMPLESAKRLIMVQKEISLRDLEHVIPYALARDIILRNPDHIVALECPCRAARSNPCQPLDVCLIVGEPFASFVAEHHHARSRWVSPTEAAAILEAEHERGHVHHAFFKDAMLGRFYAICNCCSCCCGAMQAWQGGVPMLASSGFTSQVNDAQCSGCGTCAGFCQFGAISVQDSRAIVNSSLCMGCGVCASKCTQEAISLVRAPDRGEPLEIQELMERAI